MEPVAIRTKNPGAMWPGSVSARFGSTSHENLADGNKAAIFPTFEQGIAAQFYLWKTKYAGLTLDQAIYKWSGHNSSKSYTNYLIRRVPGLTGKTVITEKFLSGPLGIEFMKAQARWESGTTYPVTDEQWLKGQDMAFGRASCKGPVPLIGVTPTTKPVIKSKTFWSSIAGIASTIAMYATDWRILATVGVLCVFGYIIWERNGKPDIRGWFK